MYDIQISLLHFPTYGEITTLVRYALGTNIHSHKIYYARTGNSCNYFPEMDYNCFIRFARAVKKD